MQQRRRLRCQSRDERSFREWMENGKNRGEREEKGDSLCFLGVSRLRPTGRRVEKAKVIWLDSLSYVGKKQGGPSCCLFFRRKEQRGGHLFE